MAPSPMTPGAPCDTTPFSCNNSFNTDARHLQPLPGASEMTPCTGASNMLIRNGTDPYTQMTPYDTQPSPLLDIACQDITFYHGGPLEAMTPNRSQACTSIPDTLVAEVPTPATPLTLSFAAPHALNGLHQSSCGETLATAVRTVPSFERPAISPQCRSQLQVGSNCISEGHTASNNFLSYTRSRLPTGDTGKAIIFFCGRRNSHSTNS